MKKGRLSTNIEDQRYDTRRMADLFRQNYMTILNDARLRMGSQDADRAVSSMIDPTLGSYTDIGEALALSSSLAEEVVQAGRTGQDFWGVGANSTVPTERAKMLGLALRSKY
jgi:hypothetical protein